MPKLRAEQLKDYTLTNLQIALNAAISQSKIADQTGDPTGWISKGTIHVVEDAPTWDGTQEGQLYYINPTDELLLGTGASPYYTSVGGTSGFDSKITVKSGSEGSDWNGTYALQFISSEAFSLDGSNLFVYLNGELMQYSASGDADYQIINTTTIKFASSYAVRSADKVTILVYTNASLSNYATKAYVDEKLSGSITLTGDTAVGGNLSPSQNNAYTLGTKDMRWGSIYLQDSINFLPIGTGDNLKIYRNLENDENTQLKLQIGTGSDDQIIFEDANQTSIMTIGGDGVVTIPGKLKVSGTVEYMNQSNTETADANFLIGVDGVRQITDVVCVADVSESLSGKYWTLTAPSGAYYVWYYTSASSTDPAVSGKTGIKVTISSGADAQTVASQTKEAIAAVTGIFSATVSGATVTVTNTSTGAVDSAADVNSGATITVKTSGVNEADGDAAYAVARASGNAKLKWNDTTHRWQAIYGSDASVTSNILTENDLESGIDLDTRYVLINKELQSGSSSIGVVRYDGLYDTGTPTEGIFYGGLVRPSATTRLNYNGDLYVHDLHTDNNSIYIGTNRISYDTTTNQLTFSDDLATVVLSDTGKIYGYRSIKYLASPKGINGAATDEAAAQEFSYYDYIILKDGYQLSTNAEYNDTYTIISTVKKINSKVRIFGQIDIGVLTSNFSITELETRIDKWLEIGATDIMFTNSGYDKQVTRNRLNTLIDYVHGKDAHVMFDATDPDDVFSTTVNETYNSAGNTSEAERGDFYFFDNFAVDTNAYSTNNGYEDNTVFNPKIEKVAAYATSVGIILIANGVIGSEYTDTQIDAYWDVFEAMAQTVCAAGYGIQYGDATTTSTHKFSYDTEYLDFYSARSTFYTSGTNNQIYTRSMSGRTVTACLDGIGSYGKYSYNNVKLYGFKKSGAFYSATSNPSSTTGSIKYDGLITAYELTSMSDVKVVNGSYTGTVALNTLSTDRTWNLMDQSGTLAIEHIAGESLEGAVKYTGVTSVAGAFNGNSVSPSSTTRLNYEGYLYATQFVGNSSTATTLLNTRTFSLAGDATGSATFNGGSDVSISVNIVDNSHNHISSNITDATSSNVASVIVKRDASGNFSAGTITANLTGSASAVSFNSGLTTTSSPTFAGLTVSGAVNSGAINATDLTLSGNLTVNGTTTTVNTTELTIQDNVVVLNKNQTGTPVSTLVSGIEVERGDLTNYQFMFRESDDTFVIGAVGSLQAVATRPDAPTANAIPYWNDTAKRFDSSTATISGSTITGSCTAVTFNGGLTTTSSPTFAGLTLNGTLAMATGIHTIASSGATSGVFNGFQGINGDNDYWFVGGSQTASDGGYMEIATGDNGTEPIYVRQYTGAPHTTAATSGTITRTATLLDASGNTTFPGSLTASKVYNAVWNDIVDFVEVDDDLQIEYGKVYIRNKSYAVEQSSTYAQKGILGIASDTFGISAGKVEEKHQIPLAIGGYVLAYTRDLYEPGTVLTSDADGYLVEMSDDDKMKYPERIVAIFDRPEPKEKWNGVVVNGRNWVKVKA